MANNWTKVGTIDVDSGSVMVGDPCYTQGRDASHASANWMDFLARTYPDTFGPKATHNTNMPDATNAIGEQGIGIVVSSGYGDGEYPVYIRYSGEGRVAELRVIFISEDEDINDLYDDDEDDDDGLTPAQVKELERIGMDADNSRRGRR